MTAPSPIALNSTTPQSSTSPTSGSVDLREINAAPNQIAQRTQTLSPAQARALAESRQKSLDELTQILSAPNLSPGERASQLLEQTRKSSEQLYLQNATSPGYVPPQTPGSEPKVFLELDTPTGMWHKISKEGLLEELPNLAPGSSKERIDFQSDLNIQLTPEKREEALDQLQNILMNKNLSSGEKTMQLLENNELLNR